MIRNLASLEKKIKELEKQLKKSESIIISFINFNKETGYYILVWTTDKGDQYNKKFKSLEELEKKVEDLSPKVIITGEDKLED